MTKQTQAWLEEHYRRWRNERPRNEDTLELFAVWLGVSRNTLSNWLNRGHNPSQESAVLLASKLGDFAIFDLLGIPRPDATLQLIIQSWGSLSDEARAEIDAIRERSAANREAGATGGRVAAHGTGHEE